MIGILVADLPCANLCLSLSAAFRCPVKDNLTSAMQLNGLPGDLIDPEQQAEDSHAVAPGPRRHKFLC